MPLQGLESTHLRAPELFIPSGLCDVRVTGISGHTKDFVEIRGMDISCLSRKVAGPGPLTIQPQPTGGERERETE